MRNAFRTNYRIAKSVLQFYIETTAIKPVGSPLFRPKATPHLIKNNSFLVTLGRQGEADQSSGSITAARGDAAQGRAAATGHRPGDTAEERGAMPAGSYAPGSKRTRVLAHGLFTAAGGLGASAAAG